MSSSRLVRGAKTRMFACICLICVLGALVYVFHGTQARLADVQKLASDCNQQQESLSAQLQVIFEYKLRLEKSLKKEKSDHDLTKENCKAREKEERETREKEKTEATNKYEALVQQSKLQKSRYEDEKEDLVKQIIALKEIKKQSEKTVRTLGEQLETTKREKDATVENLKNDYLRLKEEVKKLNETNEQLRVQKLPCDERVDRLEKQNSELKKEIRLQEIALKNCVKKEERAEVKKEVPINTNALEAPKKWQNINSSTTPGINPDALNVSPEPSSPRPSDSQRGQQDDQVAFPPKKSTQESDGGGDGGPGGLPGQIPLPPEPPHQALGPMNPVEERRGDAAVEEEDPRQREIPRRAHGEHYHGGDYDKEQPEEEDDEAEQLDYVQANDQMRKEVQMQNGPGIMVNPK